MAKALWGEAEITLLLLCGCHILLLLIVLLLLLLLRSHEYTGDKLTRLVCLGLYVHRLR